MMSSTLRNTLSLFVFLLHLSMYLIDIHYDFIGHFRNCLKMSFHLGHTAPSWVCVLQQEDEGQCFNGIICS